MYPDFYSVMAWREVTVANILRMAEAEFKQRYGKDMYEHIGSSFLRSADNLHTAPTEVLQEFARAYNIPTLHASLEKFSPEAKQ